MDVITRLQTEVENLKRQVAELRINLGKRAKWVFPKTKELETVQFYFDGDFTYDAGTSTISSSTMTITGNDSAAHHSKLIFGDFDSIGSTSTDGGHIEITQNGMYRIECSGYWDIGHTSPNNPGQWELIGGLSMQATYADGGSWSGVGSNVELSRTGETVWGELAPAATTRRPAHRTIFAAVVSAPVRMYLTPICGNFPTSGGSEIDSSATTDTFAIAITKMSQQRNLELIAQYEW